jgi:protein-S-isoprenylcysteine O-methyltransferase Ste14
MVLAGDELLPAARTQVTHHIDIDAPPAKVWPWLVQMGRGRGGWYSWDLLDNGGVRSAHEIEPALQDVSVGDVLPIKPESPDGFAVLRLEPARALVLGDPSLLPGRTAPPPGAPRGTWAFSLQPLGDAATRLVVRVRVDYTKSLMTALVAPIVRVMHEIMERKQLRTLKRRVEQPDRTTGWELLQELVGVGDRVMARTLPFAIAGLAANIVWPSFFRMGFGTAGWIAGVVLLLLGVPIWLTAAAQLLVAVPKGRLITKGAFALVLHPVYTSVALLVIPGCGLLFDSWLGFAIGAILYVSERHLAREEERELARRFPLDYPAYRERVLLPWL